MQRTPLMIGLKYVGILLVVLVVLLLLGKVLPWKPSSSSTVGASAAILFLAIQEAYARGVKDGSSSNTSADSSED